MKQAQNARKQRARPSSRKGGSNKGGNPGNARSENRVRGNPKQLLEKYKNQAREAKQAGDRVLAEYYYQFADHYQRVVNDMRGPGDYVSDQDESQNKSNGAYDSDAYDGDEGADEQQAEGNNQRGRRSRGGRRNGGRNGAEDQPKVNIAEQEQPTEVHPELDLQGTVAPEGEEKPRRRAVAPRRGRPRKDEKVAAETAQAVVAAPQGDEAA
ncbi:DUF4167 domain-containing protein [Kordiimonas marina]|uniref:DUF4167 domain-containing protein n=1 Tax=Kordiimonas marina TaxID=2872312 RepID=UPI001FF3FEC8|nr:DUF4167 domain-containing protein [Kordiimonas marina]MCJ9430446.1 DUF4167 domain-containing protein [Kordiimonas marina]